MKHFFTTILCTLFVINIFSQNFKTNWWVPNGEIKVLEADTFNQRLYIAGSFTEVGQNLPYLALLDTGSFNIKNTFLRPNGDVYCAIPDNNGGWYIGGNFTVIGHQIRNNIARINSDGTLHSWNPNSNGIIRTMFLDGATLYVGGDFSYIGTKTRYKLAALDTQLGIANNLQLIINNNIHSLAILGSRMYIGGAFSSINYTPVNKFAILDKQTGNILNGKGANGNIYTIKIDGNNLLIGGQFSIINQINKQNLAKIDSVGNVSIWNPNPNGIVRTIEIAGNKVYIGGNFTNVSGFNRKNAASFINENISSWNPIINNTVYSITELNNKVVIGGTFNDVNGISQKNFAMVDTLYGNFNFSTPSLSNAVFCLTKFDTLLFLGGAFASYGTQFRKGIVALDLNTGELLPWNPNINGTVNVIYVDGKKLFIGGAFTSVNGISRNNSCAFELNTLALTAWNPLVVGGINTISVINDSVYMGGWISNVNGINQSKLTVVDTSTGVLFGWNHSINNGVTKILIYKDTLFVGGYFDTINGLPIGHIAAFHLQTGNLIPLPIHIKNWALFDMAINNDTLYLAGSFTYVNNVERIGLATFKLSSNTLTNFNLNSFFDPGASYFLRLKIANGRICAAGNFSLKNSFRINYVELDGEGKILSRALNPDNKVNDISFVANKLILGGSYASISYSHSPYLSVIKLSGSDSIKIELQKPKFCTPDTLVLPFFTSCVFDSTNAFILQLSSKKGSYNDFLNLDTIYSTNSDTFHVVLSNSMVPSDLYNFRVVSSNPIYQSDELQNAYTISKTPQTSISGLPDTLCKQQTVEFYGSPEEGIFTSTGNMYGNKFYSSMSPVGKHFVTYYYSDSFGCDHSTTDSLIVDYCNSVEEFLSFEKNITVYPNPISPQDNLFIKIENEIKTNYTLEIFDLLGNIVLQKPLQQNSINSLAINLKSGTYLISIKSDKTVYNKNLIVF
ncbi:hypothetical protein FLAV_00701 [Flavobacteriales bacterium]|nr:hypothetical protein FLAV_00701 [Flavobacteriales bacterium]